MFGLSKNKTTNSDENQDKSENLKEKIDQDLRVRNMPNWQKSSVSFSKTKSSELNYNSGLSSHVGEGSAKSRSSHQTIGLVIIGGGLVLIAALVYLSYLFIIKPSLQPEATNTPEEVENIIENTELSSSPVEIDFENSAEVIETNPVILDIEETESVSSSSLDLIDETMPEEGVIILVEELEPILDSDNDGLNDEEEILLGTDINNTDTNGNTYPDLVEVENNYDPLGSGSLANNSNLSVYTDDVYGFQLLYPREFEYDSLNDNQVLLFSAPDGSFFQISIQENLEQEDLSTWYAKMFPENIVSYDKIKVNSSWEGIESQDSLNFYLTSNEKTNIFTISYIPALTGRIAYPNIFSMMIESLFFL